MKNFIFSLSAFFLSFLSSAQHVVDFEDFVFNPIGNFWNGSDGTGNFTINGATFNNSYNDAWGSWSGFAASAMNDLTTPGWNNQYSCFAGSGVNGSSNFALWYANGEITFAVPTQMVSMAVTNTVYAAISMRDGDAYAKQFGSIYNADGEEDGTDGLDWFRLTITGMDADDQPTGIVEFYLADFRSDESLQHYILDVWETLDLSSLGSVNRLVFQLESSDNGEWGMNTPGYFALDQLVFWQSGVGLIDENFANYLVYPNPANDIVFLRSSDASDFSIALVNANGQRIIEKQESTQNEIRLDLTNLNSGIYFIQFISDQGTQVQKLVVHH